MMISKPIAYSSFFLLLLASTACAAPGALTADPDATGCDRLVDMYEMGSLTLPRDMQRMDSHAAIENCPMKGTAGLGWTPERPGTWIYMGLSEKGSMKSIFQLGSATPLPKGNFNADLEIVPKTHPVDIRPSTDKTASNGSFSFSLLAQGESCKESLEFYAYRAGEEIDPAAAPSKTMMGTGKARIDAPGTWWITVKRITEDGSEQFASITFHVAGRPGPDHYAAFTQEGKYLKDLASVAAHVADAEVIFVGENHNDPVAHLLEAEILTAVHDLKKEVALSLEMFERDVQPVMDGYLMGLHSEKQFLKASRPWPRYDRDYRPMVEFAREQGFAVIAANAPRRLVNLVSRLGPEKLEELPDGEKIWLPPLPYYIPEEGRYVDKLNEVFSGFGDLDEKEEALPGPRTKRGWLEMGKPRQADYDEKLLALGKEDAPHGMGGMPAHVMKMLANKKGGNPSQSLWDASMAHSIASFLEKHPQTTVVQVNGAFHSNEHLGTVEQLLRYRPETRVAVISLRPDEAFPAFDQKALGMLGNIIIITDPTWQPDHEEP